ncbi:AraC-like DNA-binding protein [Bradyrhizobium sp. GM24.11]
MWYFPSTFSSKPSASLSYPTGVSAWEWSGPIALHRRVMIQFDLSSTPSLVRLNLEKSGPMWMTQDPAILQCSARLAHAIEEGTHGRTFVSAIALAMIARFAELGTTLPVGGLSRERLCKAQDFLIGNLSADIKMSDLAQRVGLSESRFVRAFRASTGLPLTDGNSSCASTRRNRSYLTEWHLPTWRLPRVSPAKVILPASSIA